MKKIYIASPMFSAAELIFNEQLATSLEKIGLDVFLPQRSGYRLIELMKTMPAEDAKMVIFKKDFEAVQNCDIILIVLDGRTIDEGACVELGFGYASGKLCYGLKTDPRTMSFDLFYKHFVFHIDEDGYREKVLKDYLQVRLVINLECGDMLDL